MSCSKCSEDFSSPSEVVRCVECKCEFHPGCCRVRTVAKLRALISSGASWQCEDCRKDSSSVGSKSDTDDPSMLTLLKNIQMKIAEDNNMFKASFSSLEQSMSRVQDSLALVTARLTVVEDDNVKLKAECDQLRKENGALNRRVELAERSVIDIDQYVRMTNLEIRGIPQTGGEDIYAVLESVAGALGVQYEKRDISIAHRLQVPRDSRFHPTIIVQFALRSVRADWLAAARKRRIQTTDLHASLSPGPVYINEQLTQHNRSLLQRGRAGVRSGHLAYAWCRDGKVFVRQTPTSRAVRIHRSFNEMEFLPKVQDASAAAK